VPGDYLVRAVADVNPDPDGARLDLVAVAVNGLGDIPGLLTAEPAFDQGLERRLPNAPEVGAAGDIHRGRDGVAEGLDTAPAVMRVRAVAADTIRVTLTRGGGPDGDGGASGGAPDHGILAGSPPSAPLLVEAGAGVTAFDSGSARLEVGHLPFRWVLRDGAGRAVARSGGDRRQVAGLPYAAAVGFGPAGTRLAVELAPGEAIAGLGEHFSSVVHNGRLLELAATDALGSGSALSYKTAPLLHSSAGYSLFVHTPGPMAVDVGARHGGLIDISVEEDRLDLFFLVGPDLAGRLRRYGQLTGRAPMPPRWALGVWMSRCRYRSRAELESVAGELRRRRFPCDVLHIDPDWLVRDKLNCDFEWSEEKYPDPASMFDHLHREGFRVSVWELPYLDPDSDMYREGEQRGYLVRDAGGRPAAGARTPSRDGRPRGLVDFSNPEARDWWKRANRRLLDLGTDVLKCDFGEGLPDDAVMSDGRPGRSWRNLYPLWYHRTVFEAMAEAGRPPLLYGRSGWAGSQRYPAQWGGDPEASVAGLAAAIRAGLGWGLSAPGLYGHDVGGFYGSGPTPELYVRWAQAGCLSPLTRFHGLGPREPWHFGARAEAIVGDFARLRYRLLPYLWSALWECADDSLPVMRSLALECPDDPLMWRVEHQWLLGPDLLVAPVLSDSPDPVETTVILPPGDWCDFWEGTVHRGPGAVRFCVPLERVPLLVRAGAVIPMGPAGLHTGEIDPEDWELHIWADPSGSTPPHPTVVRDGADRFVYRPEGAPGAAVTHLSITEVRPRARRAVLHRPGSEEPLPVVAGPPA
jgi:alpha-D-xyloside xylohydrolase